METATSAPFWTLKNQQENADLGPDYVEFIPGDVGIILSIPHGGFLDDVTIPDRSEAQAANLINNNTLESDPKPVKVRTTTDAFTVDLGAVIYETIVDKMDKHPYVVVCHLKR